MWCLGDTEDVSPPGPSDRRFVHKRSSDCSRSSPFCRIRLPVKPERICREEINGLVDYEEAKSRVEKREQQKTCPRSQIMPPCCALAIPPLALNFIRGLVFECGDIWAQFGECS